MSTPLARLRSRPYLSVLDGLRLGALAAALLALLLVFVARALASPSHDVSTLVGKPAPTFSLPAEQQGTLLSYDVALNATGHHPVLLVFFHTLCAHCLSGLRTAHAVETSQARTGLRVLFIDSPGESAKTADAYVQRVSIAAPILLDAHGQVAARYGFLYSPTLLLLDAHSVVRNVWVGEPSAATLDAALTALPAH